MYIQKSDDGAGRCIRGPRARCVYKMRVSRCPLYPNMLFVPHHTQPSTHIISPQLVQHGLRQPSLHRTRLRLYGRGSRSKPSCSTQSINPLTLSGPHRARQPHRRIYHRPCDLGVRRARWESDPAQRHRAGGGGPIRHDRPQLAGQAHRFHRRHLLRHEPS